MQWIAILPSMESHIQIHGKSLFDSKTLHATTETWDEMISFYLAFGFKIDRYLDGDVHMFKELDF